VDSRRHEAPQGISATRKLVCGRTLRGPRGSPIVHIAALIQADSVDSSGWRNRAAKRLDPASQKTDPDAWCRRLLR
jgi:hypothetical protein